MSKRLKAAAELYDVSKLYSVVDAVDIIKKAPPVKFDETIELSFKLGVDARHSDQIVRGSVILPHGLGKTKCVLVFAKGDKAQEARDAGADHVGDEDLVAKIQEGWFDFDSVVATPDMMKEIAKLGRQLGTRGLMPNPKTGTVTNDITRVVGELKAGKLDFRVDKANDIHLPIGKISFEASQISENAQAVIDAVIKAKPLVSKGQYLKKMCLASTMGCGVKLSVA